MIPFHSVPRTFLLLLLSLLLPLSAHAFEGRLLDASGRPIAGAQVSVAGSSGAYRTGTDGVFVIQPEPVVPATLVVIGPRGELYPPIALTTLAMRDVRVEPAVYAESVTVSAGATPNVKAPPAAAAVILGREEQEERKPQHLPEMIERIPGAAVRGSGPAAVPVLRGLAGGRTLILYDDARILSERRAGPSATFVDPFDVASVEVSRGPGSVAYGSDALGGVIHMRPHEPVPGSQEIRYDVWSSRGGESISSAGVEMSGDVAGGSMLVVAHRRSSDGGNEPDGDPIANAMFDDAGLALRYARQSGAWRLRTSGMWNRAWDVGVPLLDPAATRTVYPAEVSKLALFAADRDPSAGGLLVSLRGSFGTHDVTTNRVARSGTTASRTIAHDGSLRLTLEKNTSSTRLAAGADLVTRFDLRAAPSVDDADRVDGGAFAIVEQRLTTRAMLSAGLRADAIRSANHGGYFGTQSRSDVAWSGHGGVTFGPFDGVTASLQAARGYREPSLSDRYFRGISGRGFVTGNPLLEPERSTQFDGALRLERSRLSAGLYAYRYEIRNLVERYGKGQDFFFRNRGEAEIEGVEVEVAARLNRGLSAHLGAATSRGEADGSSPLDDIAPPTLHATLRWAGPRGSAYATLSSYGDDDRPGPVEVARGGYTALDLGGGWRFTNALEVRLALRNALDEERFASSDPAAPLAAGRSVTLGVNGRWDWR